MTTLWVLVVMGGAIVIYRLLLRVTEMGGTSDRDATETVEQVWSEADVFRGRMTPHHRPWDGQRRIATLRRRFR